MSTPLAPNVARAVAYPARLAAVETYRLAGHAGDPDLDAVVAHMARLLRAPMAVINLVGPDLQCYPAEHGVGAPSTSVPDALSFCAYVVADRAPLTVPDAADHPVFAGNPLVATGAVAAYLGVPLIYEDGFVLGALSVFDTDPRQFTADDQEALQTLAGLVRAVLSLRRRVLRQEWDARLLAVQGQVLEEVATGGPLLPILGMLDAAVAELSPGADPARRQALADTVDRLTAIATESDTWRSTIRRMAHHDPLTGLVNRAQFHQQGAAALAAGGGAVLFIDVDRFKDVNDRGGHAVGDQLLVQLAEELRSRLTTAVPAAVIGRLGGDEFAAVLPGLDREAATALAAELVTALTAQATVGRRTVQVSVSIGLAMSRPAADFHDVLHAADEAMYTAKSNGRGRLHYDGTFEP
ncbi:sensor domain-containing diguanylate cyclase [Blastococcus mobilis]|uniref:Diguanylate cyclase with GAF sensor n=1 Tax=Blastococcus mobilis TaxID=1938746 RepID=A0A238X2H3_9ACTN|nr:sensor domain-containing diguanylate cyclase [Blastococcus mobilis]SNR52624.1 diguanylate cyclase with GAF sensor [Blastococcus mobilis]